MSRNHTPPAAFNDASEYIAIPMAPVESSQVKAIGYDEATETMAVTFQHGARSIYHYLVPQQLYRDFMAAESKGRFFRLNVKPLRFKKFPAELASR
jgi:hypothetical protein